MDATVAKLELCSFYSKKFFEIKDCCINESSVIVKLKSKTKSCECPKCHQISTVYHGTYTRSVQDLPILGKNTSVIITAHEYECQNEKCSTKTIVEHVMYGRCGIELLAAKIMLPYASKTDI